MRKILIVKNKWRMLFALMIIFSSSHLYALTLSEEARLRIKNANVFKTGDTIELAKGKHFVACATKENLNKILKHAASHQANKILAMLDTINAW
jgi:hypothetical protein